MVEAAHTPPLVLCVAGSPRRNGNSARLLRACIEGIEQAGGIADVLELASEPVSGCTGCNRCGKTGVCAVSDSMTAIYSRIDAAHALVIASPIYFATVPASLKALLDRFQPYWVRRYVLGHPVADPKRPGALLLVGGGGDPFGSKCAIAPVKSALAVAGVELSELMEVVGPDARGDVDGLTDSLGQAREIGRKLVQRATDRA